MAGKAVKSAVTKAVVKYQYPWKEKLAKYKDELSKGVWGYWHLGAWKPLDLSGRHCARLRKEVLLAGQDWPYDPARKEMRNKRKGHKCDRISAEKRANTAELMKKMPEMLLDYKINASDDRSSSTIESKILDVVQMNSVMADGKPKCLVIDEIDGALGEGKGAVEAILKLVAADKKSLIGKENNAQEAKPGKLSSRKGPKALTLSRPVICICNDLFAPALRPLRQVAKVHTFVQPTVSRVVNRLKYICNKEGFKASAIALTALAEFTECDIRSCLNTLQFLNKKKETLNTLEVGSQVVGRKDISKSVYDVWKEVFQKRKAKRERKSTSGSNSSATDFDFLYSLISNRYGNSELTMIGIHENFLQLHYHDPMMQKTYMMRTQQMSLLVYQPSIMIAIRSLIAQVEKPNIEWPKSFHRYRATSMEKKDILKLW